MASRTKRKAAPGEEQVTMLSQSLEEYKQQVKPYSFFKKVAFLEFLSKDPKRVYSLFLSGVVHGPRLDCYSVPATFRPFETVRDKNCKITEIKDATSTIDGKELASIVMIANIKENGYAYGYFHMSKPSWMLGLKNVMTDEFKYAVPKTDYEVEATRIYTYAAQTACYATADEILRVLSHDYVKVEDFKSIAMAVSAVVKEGIDVDKFDFSSPKSLATQLNSTNAAVVTQKLAQTLYASHLKELDLDGKIEAFQNNPSPRLASMIDLRMPTKLLLFNSASKAPVQPVALGQLSGEDEIVLSNVAISQEFYQRVTVAKDLPVVKMVKNLAVKNKNQTLVPLRTVDTMKATDFLKIASAIEVSINTSGESGKTDASVKEVEAKDLESFFDS
jgi:hypothetical protein